jgi:ADP-ribose pyrophosphatase YjhB (NUDIX family)
MFKNFMEKLFPSGIGVFLVLAFITWLLEMLFSIVVPYFSYLPIILYVIYLFSFIKKDGFFPLQPYIQWLLFFGIPIFSSVVALSALLSFDTNLSIINLLKSTRYTSFLLLVFFLCVLIIWTCILAIKHMTNRKKFFAYAATCVPIKKDSSSSNVKICLIKNKSHSQAAWMFPGGHVDLSKNNYSENDDSLSNVSVTPESIVIEKASEEAGLLNLEFVSLSNYLEGRTQLETGWSLKAPAFNYLFKVNNSANCFSTLHHRVHLDFTYIVSYSEIKNPKYDTYEFEIAFDKLPPDSDKAISNIEDQLTKKLNAHINHYKPAKKKPSHVLFPDSIPEIIYCSCKYYLAWVDSQNLQTK